MEATLFTLFGLPVTPYALSLAIALGAGLLRFYLDGRKKSIADQALWRVMLLSLPLGLLGARAFYCLASLFLYEEIGLERVFYLWEGGYAIWGAIGGAALAAFLAGRTSRVPVSSLLDTLAPVGAAVIAVAREIEYFTGEGVGPYVENPLFQWFPLAVYRADYEIWYLAVFSLEALAAIVIAIFLYRKKRPAGDTARLFQLLYSGCQITLESLRRDHCLRWLFVRVSQLTALIVILGLMAFATVRVLKSARGKKPGWAALPWLAVAAFSGAVVAIEFSFDGKILRDLPVWCGYLIMACCSLGIICSAYPLIFWKPGKEARKGGGR